MKVAKQTRTGGFTLIELIVVIAILGILAGVGTVAYTGYIKAANKGVDQQLVGDIAYAIQLADYAHPGMLDGQVGMVVLTDADEPKTVLDGEHDELFEASLKDAIPDLETARLKYNWGVNTGTVNTILDSLDTTGLSAALSATNDEKSATVSYATNANQMWNAVSELAGTLSEQFPDMEPGEYVALAAQYSNDNYGKDTMSALWQASDPDTLFDFYQSSNNSNVEGNATAFCAALLARNFAFTEYLKDADVKLSQNDIAILQNYRNEDGEVDQMQAFNLASEIIYLQDEKANAEVDNDPERFEAAKELFKESYPIEADPETLLDAYIQYTTATAYTGEDGKTYTQAEVDGIAYYTLMKNVNDISTGSDAIYDPTSSSYLSDLSGYVTMAGQICSGKLNTDALKEALNATGSNTSNTVIILAQKNGNVMTISTTPVEAWGGEQS